MRHLLIASCLLAGGLPSARPAEACLNGVVLEQDEAARLVARAEKDLDRGKYRRVLRSLYAEHYLVDAPLLRKIRTLQAVAELRLGRSRAAERRLRALLRRDQDNPYLRTRLAEALARRRGGDAIEAWQILDDLEARDLIPDAHGYAALARLRARAHDAVGQARAVEECLRRAREPAICPAA